METVYLTEEQDCHTHGVRGLLTSHKMSHLRKAVDDHKDGIKATLCTRQA